MLKNIFYIVIALVLVPLGCKKDCPCDDPTNKDCPNYDPCLSVQKPNANFKMRFANPSFPYRDGLIPEFCDTIWGGGVQFVADMDNALSYSWKIGADSRTFTEKNFKLGFTSYTQDTNANLQDNRIFYKPLEIKLNVRNRQNNCWEDADTLTTQTRKLYFVNGNLNFGLMSYFGSYKGRFENEAMDRVVSFQNVDIPNSSKYEQRLINIPTHDTFVSQFYHLTENLRTFKTFYFPITHQQNQKWYDWLNGLIYFRIDREYSPDGRHHIRLEYRIINRDETEIKTYKFTGRKLL